jgi:hypothetical protein
MAALASVQPRQPSSGKPSRYLANRQPNWAAIGLDNHVDVGEDITLFIIFCGYSASN